MDSPASPQSLLPAPKPRRPLAGILFRSPEDQETTDPSPSDLPPLSPQDDSASASASPHDAPLDPPAPAPTSSGASATPEPERIKVVKPVDREGITRTAIAVVEGAGAGAHQLLAKDEVDQALHRYLVSEQEAVQIGTPLGSLAARHSGGVAGLGNPDVNDLIQAGVGLALYAVRQLSLAAHSRNVKAGRLHDQLQQTPEGHRGSPADGAVNV